MMTMTAFEKLSNSRDISNGTVFGYNLFNNTDATPGGGGGGGVSEGRGGQMVSDFTRDLFIVINHVVFDMCICLFGIVGNCVNITVFVRQGLRRSVNLSLCAMSFSDLLGLVFQTWQNICLNPYMQETSDVPVDFIEVQILTGGCPNVLMIRITGWITMYITFERCLSVLIPLKIRRIITFERTVVILVFICALNISFFLILYARDYLGWEFIPTRNMTVLTVSNYYDNDTILDFIFNSGHFYLSIIAFILVVIFTGVLVVNLKKRSLWRRGVTSDGDQQEALSKRENKTIGMVVAVATVMIVCYAPGVLCSIISSFIKSFSFSGEPNLYHVVWSFCFLFHSINSSINVILYFKMSSKYRTTAEEIFPFLKKKEKSSSANETHN